MLSVALVTLALLAGDCPTCGPATGPAPYSAWNGAPNGPPRRVHYHPWHYVLPKPIVGCAGSYCASCNRPYFAGGCGYDYRTDFNYPWSQEPLALYPRPDAVGEETMFTPEELPLPKQSRRDTSKSQAQAARTKSFRAPTITALKPLERR